MKNDAQTVQMGNRVQCSDYSALSPTICIILFFYSILSSASASLFWPSYSRIFIIRLLFLLVVLAPQ